MSIYTLSNGTSYDVQILHSSHNVKVARDFEQPGSLRQIVDNIARSLHRRVSFCQISEVRSAPIDSRDLDALDTLATIDPLLAVAAAAMPFPEEFENVPVGQGLSVTFYEDTFRKRFGFEHALLRALRTSRMPRELKNELALRVGKVSYDELQVRYARPGQEQAVQSALTARAEANSNSNLIATSYDAYFPPTSHEEEYAGVDQNGYIIHDVD